MRAGGETLHAKGPHVRTDNGILNDLSSLAVIEIGAGDEDLV
jgi:hypothetical protein